MLPAIDETVRWGRGRVHSIDAVPARQASEHVGQRPRDRNLGDNIVQTDPANGAVDAACPEPVRKEHAIEACTGAM